MTIFLYKSFNLSCYNFDMKFLKRNVISAFTVIRNSSMMSYKLYILTATLKIILNKIKLRKENREERKSVEKDRII